jgi:hypothetical protein
MTPPLAADGLPRMLRDRVVAQDRDRTWSWLHHFHRLRIRWERRSDIQEAFITPAEALICLNVVTNQLC